GALEALLSQGDRGEDRIRAGAPRSARARALSPNEPDDARMADPRPVPCDLLPQRDDLFRSRGAAARPRAFPAAAASRRALVRGSRGRAFALRGPVRARGPDGLSAGRRSRAAMISPASRVDCSSYYDARLGRHVHKLAPGCFHVATADELISTLLGSCVAACIYDPLRAIGGMNHFLLPHGKPDDRHGAPVSSSNRYGVFAMESL